jgi:molybdopterin/thiamine biosynthesis adenylyltransferase
MMAAKNLALAGIKSLTLHDQNAIDIADLSSQVPPFPFRNK